MLPQLKRNIIMENKDKQYVVLRHLTMPDKGKCFFTTNNPDEPEEEKGLSAKGERWYEVIGYADTVQEAQDMCATNYGGLPSMKEFDDYAKEQVRKKYKIIPGTYGF
jgi:hypothetical protein